MDEAVVLTWCLHALVVVWVDAHLILLGVECKLTEVDGPQLVVGLQVRPAPQAAVDDVRKAFPVGHLQAPVQGPDGTRTQDISLQLQCFDCH